MSLCLISPTANIIQFVCYKKKEKNVFREILMSNNLNIEWLDIINIDNQQNGAKLYIIKKEFDFELIYSLVLKYFFVF